MLNESARSFVKSFKGNRFNEDIKMMSVHKLVTNGQNSYRTESGMSSLPSLKTARRAMSTLAMKFVPGKIYADELLTFLKDRNLPLTVFGCADLTRISGRIEYDAASNSIYGLTPFLDNTTGFPDVEQFIALTPSQMFEFTQKSTVANYAEAFMIKPMAKGNQKIFVKAL